jgi:hypothetical protein
MTCSSSKQPKGNALKDGYLLRISFFPCLTSLYLLPAPKALCIVVLVTTILAVVIYYEVVVNGLGCRCSLAPGVRSADFVSLTRGAAPQELQVEVDLDEPEVTSTAKRAPSPYVAKSATTKHLEEAWKSAYKVI